MVQGNLQKLQRKRGSIDGWDSIRDVIPDGSKISEIREMKLL